MAEWLRRGLQILLSQFDSGRGLRDILNGLLNQSVIQHQQIDYPAIKEYEILYAQLQTSLTSAAGGNRNSQRKSKLTKNRTKKTILSKKNRSLKMIKIQK